MPKTHTVKQGDCISSIAFNYGFFPDTLWNDSSNADLKNLRKDPNALFPGDLVMILDKTLGEESCATEQRHRFRRLGVPEVLKMQFLIEGEPRADEPYTLEIDGVVISGTTSGEGKIEHAIPPNAKKGKVMIGQEEEREKYVLLLGGIDPISEITGVQARLQNLGWYAGPVDGISGPKTTSAIRRFQEHYERLPSQF